MASRKAMGDPTGRDVGVPIKRTTSVNPSSRLSVCGLLRICLVFALGAGLFDARPVNASSVVEVGLTDLVARSEFIFEGKVRHTRAWKEANSRHIWTRITFDVVDVIKGNSQPRFVALDFLGGTYGGKTLHVTDMVLPKTNEHGVYFVESTRRHQVHPFYGWAQGHFVVVVDSGGNARVTTTGAQPVLGLARTDRAQTRKRLSTGIARGVMTHRSARVSQAMSLSEFKRRLSNLVATP